MANTVGTLNLLQSIVDTGLELEKFDTAGTSEEYGNVRESVAHQHDFGEDGELILHERSPINPKSIYATAKVAADFLTMNYHDAFGVPGVVTRMFNNYGPRQNPRYVTGTIITQALERETIELGALEPMRDFCFCTDGVRGHLTVAAQGIPGDVYVYGQGKNVTMKDWSELILEIGRERGLLGRPRGRDDAAPLRPGCERGDGAARRLREAARARPAGSRSSRGKRASSDHRVVRREPRTLDRPRRLAAPPASPRRAHGPREVLVTGGGGFLGSHLVERLQAEATTSSSRGAPTTTSRARTTRSGCSTTRGPSSSSTSRPRSAASAPTARTPAATGTRT